MGSPSVNRRHSFVHFILLFAACCVGSADAAKRVDAYLHAKKDTSKVLDILSKADLTAVVAGGKGGDLGYGNQ